MPPSTLPFTKTLADLLEAYDTEYLPALSASAQRHYRRVYRLLCEQYGPLPLTEITPSLLKDWRRQITTGHKPATVRAYLAYLSGAFRAAVDDFEWLDHNPLHTVRRPPKPAGRTRYLSDDELAALLAACQQSQQRLLEPIVLVTLATGGRREEVTRLRWTEVDLQRALVVFLYTKNRQPRSVPLAHKVLGVLRLHKTQATTPWVFPCPTGERPLSFETAWRTARKRAGLANFRFHDLRHSAASFLARSGASLYDIKEILGHRDIAQTLRYVHLIESHTRGVIERMGETFLSSVLGVSTAGTLVSVWLNVA